MTNACSKEHKVHPIIIVGNQILIPTFLPNKFEGTSNIITPTKNNDKALLYADSLIPVSGIKPAIFALAILDLSRLQRKYDKVNKAVR